MHELSIAHSLIGLIEEQLSSETDRVRTVKLRIGALSAVVPAALRSAFRVAASGTAAEGAVLEIESVSVTAWCDACNVERQITGMMRLVCPVCGARMPRIICGRELELVSLEVFDVARDANCRSSPESAQAE